MENAQSNILTTYHTDDNFISFLRERMNTMEQHLFIESFKMYLQHGRNEKSFVVNLDDIWEKIGFTRKGPCKRVLEKNFEIGKHYIIKIIDENLASPTCEASLSINDTDESKKHGGHNKEIILMSVKTFKKLCMISQTSKAEIVQEYYLKMEEVLQDYMEKIIQEEQIEKQKLLTDLSDTKEKALWERHNALLAGFAKTKLVYMIYMFSLQDGKYVIKLGESDDLRDRFNHICSSFKVKGRVLDVFPVEKNYEFEQYLHHHDKFYPFKYLEPINGKISNETYLIHNEKQYKKFKNFICSEKHKFISRNVEELKLIAEIKKLEFLEKMTDLFGNDIQKLEKILSNSISITINKNYSNISENIQKQTKNPEEIIEQCELSEDKEEQDDQTDEEEYQTNQAESAVEIKIERKKQGSIIQLYDPQDLTKVVKVINSISEALQDIPETSLTHIKFAVAHKTIYKGYRWHFIERIDPNPNISRNIGATIDIIQRNTGFVARMNIDGTIVEKVYRNQIEACEEMGFDASQISGAIKFNKLLSGYYWNLWDNIDNNIQEIYLQNHQLPNKNYKPRGVKVYKLDINTKKTVEEFGSIDDVRAKLGITAKTIKRYSMLGEPYKGFLWKIN